VQHTTGNKSSQCRGDEKKDNIMAMIPREDKIQIQIRSSDEI